MGARRSGRQNGAGEIHRRPAARAEHRRHAPGQPLTSHATVTGTSVHIEGSQAGRGREATATIAADSLILPSPFWGPFEALAARLKTAPAGSTIPMLTTVVGEIQVGDSHEETIQTPGRAIRTRITQVKLSGLDAEVWGDEDGHLLRLSIPLQSLEVVREDIASVAARRDDSRAGDEPVRIAANGAIAGTASRPETGGTRSCRHSRRRIGPTDRDETVAGIPIFSQLAGLPTPVPGRPLANACQDRAAGGRSRNTRRFH